MKTILLIILIIISGVFTADQIVPDLLSVSKTEGESVTLKCSYETSSNDIWLHWFRQYPNRALQYLLFKGARSKSDDGHTADNRFESSASRSSTDLTVTVRLADTALYYCALDVRGLGYPTDALTFGKPISLQVLPRENSPILKPQLSILSASNDGPKMCLAAGFYPKEGEMSLTLEDGNTEAHSISRATLSKSSTYYYAGFSSKNIDKCKLQNEETTANANDGKKGTKVDQVAPTCASPNKKTSVIKSTSDPKENTMSLIVMAVRILMAKAVAVNVMMTIKAFLV